MELFFIRKSRRRKIILFSTAVVIHCHDIFFTVLDLGMRLGVLRDWILLSKYTISTRYLQKERNKIVFCIFNNIYFNTKKKEEKKRIVKHNPNGPTIISVKQQQYFLIKS